MIRGRGVACVLVAFAAGCSSPKTALIVSEPTGAFIQVDGNNVGRAPVEATFNFGRSGISVVSASMVGYFRAETRVTRDTFEKQIPIALMADESWRATTTSEATNSWLRIQINPTLQPDAVWQKIVDSITNRYSSIEQTDVQSGYLRSTAMVRRFPSPHGEFRIRTRFLCSISSREPLVYKLKVEADRADHGDEWGPYSRIFKEDATLIEELQNRLGLNNAKAPSTSAEASTKPKTDEKAAANANGSPDPSTVWPPTEAACACGARVRADAKFCSQCGTKRE
jgi:hypothetical protein